jgi:two-component system nitrogen regulation response regulator NtrX
VSSILIVDDEETIRRSLSGILSDEGFETASAADRDAALASIRSAAPDLVLLDIAMPGADGVEVLGELRERWPEVPVVMMSGHGTIETAVRTTRMGAFDFIEKPLSIDKLLITIEHALERSQLERENRRLRAGALRAHEILGTSDLIAKLKEQIAVAGPSNGRVLITGENGTGKELVARQIHLQSKRVDHPFVEVNCAAIPGELIESELFGHEKGAFTGAASEKRGRFELADRGTIFLDEIADMSPSTQAKVLRVLQEHAFERVGGTGTIEVDVRVIAATNRDLEEEIASGRFREDLYYRLNVIPFRVPSLRERRQDIPVLVRAFVEEFCRDSGLKTKELTEQALAVLRAHSWPGNVRELRNLMERLVIMTPGERIDADHLPESVGTLPNAAAAAAATLGEARRDFERRWLLVKLREHGGNISRTAAAVGLARESLSRKVKAFSIEIERE